MSYVIDLQNVCDNALPIAEDQLIAWAELTLARHLSKAELTLRFVEPAEIQALNNTYRHQDKPTNVLAFPSEIPKHIELDFPLLGDIIICPKVLEEESIAQEKSISAHWAHIVIHGILHLLGYDHISDNDAKIMQAQEIELLSQLNFDNPYKAEEGNFE